MLVDKPIRILKRHFKEEDVRLVSDLLRVKFMDLVLTCMPGERYHRQLRFLLYLRYAFQALINSTVCLSILLGNGREIFEFST